MSAMRVERELVRDFSSLFQDPLPGRHQSNIATEAGRTGMAVPGTLVACLVMCYIEERMAVEGSFPRGCSIRYRDLIDADELLSMEWTERTGSLRSERGVVAAARYW